MSVDNLTFLQRQNSRLSSSFAYKMLRAGGCVEGGGGDQQGKAGIHGREPDQGQSREVAPATPPAEARRGGRSTSSLDRAPSSVTRPPILRPPTRTPTRNPRKSILYTSQLTPAT
jgi:hypothetical protein